MGPVDGPAELEIVGVGFLDGLGHGGFRQHAVGEALALAIGDGLFLASGRSASPAGGCRRKRSSPSAGRPCAGPRPRTPPSSDHTWPCRTAWHCGRACRCGRAWLSSLGSNVTRKAVVGVARFELTTPCAQGRCATRLRYTPIRPSLGSASYPIMLARGKAQTGLIIRFLEHAVIDLVACPDAVFAGRRRRPVPAPPAPVR